MGPGVSGGREEPQSQSFYFQKKLLLIIGLIVVC